MLDIAEARAFTDETAEGGQICNQDPSAHVDQIRLHLAAEEVIVHGAGHPAGSDDPEVQEVDVEVVGFHDRNTVTVAEIKPLPEHRGETPGGHLDVASCPTALVAGAELRHRPPARLIRAEQRPVLVATSRPV